MPSLSSSSSEDEEPTKPTATTQSFLSDEEDEKVSKLQKRRLEFEKMRQERERSDYAAAPALEWQDQLAVQ